MYDFRVNNLLPKITLVTSNVQEDNYTSVPEKPEYYVIELGGVKNTK